MNQTEAFRVGQRVRVTAPGEPGFDGLTGTVLRWEARYGRWWVRLDRWPAHQPRIHPAGDPRADDLPVEADEIEGINHQQRSVA